MLEPSDIRDALIALLRGFGAIVASAVYLGGMFAWAHSLGDAAMFKMAGASAGVTYLGYVAQLLWPNRLILTRGLVLASVLLGLAVGLVGLFYH